MAAPPRTAFLLLIALLALCAGGKAILYDTLDPDTFWHLKVADQLHHEGIHPLTDHLSYQSNPQPWTPYSWLAELAMKSIWDTGGYRLAILAQSILVAAFVLILAKTTRSDVPQPPSPGTPGEGRGEGLLRATVATTFATFLSLPYLSFRPATLAITLLALAYLILQRNQTKPNKSTLLLLPLTALLANIHLYAFLIPLWLTARTLAGPARKQWAALTLATTLAACATPLLPGVLQTLLHYQFHDPMVASRAIAEMQPFWQGPMGKVAAALVLAFFTCILINRNQLAASDWLLLAGSTILLFLHGRYAPLFAIVAAPLLAKTLPRLSDRPLGHPFLRPAVAALLLVGLIRLTTAFPSPTTPLDQWLNRHGPESPGYPTAAADRLLTLHPTRIINEFTWGGYLAWRANGQFQILLDGRTQCFSPNVWQRTCLAPAADLPANLSALPPADAALLPRQNSRFRAALTTLGWRTTYADDRAEILLPPVLPLATSR